MKKVTLAKIRKACREAHWQAIHDTRLEYRVCIDSDNEIVVRYDFQGSNTWYRNSRIYRTYKYLDIDLGEMKADAIGLNWLQGEFIREQLDWDAEEIYKEYLEERRSAQ